MPVALIDLLAAHQLKEGILLALYQRLQHGKGAEVRVSLYAAALASLANQASNWLMAGHIPQPMGTAHPNIAPYGDAFLTKDSQYVVLAVGTDKQYADLEELLGLTSSHPQLRLTTNDLRVRHRTELLALLSPALRLWEAASFLQACEQKGIPAAAIRNMKEVFSQPEAMQWVLEDQLSDGTTGKRVKTAVFELLP
jgi:crotonobetainyl-CoA:carnitine CoA-transferase CaiB-like acyl-CoA transferase